LPQTKDFPHNPAPQIAVGGLSGGKVRKVPVWVGRYNTWRSANPKRFPT